MRFNINIASRADAKFVKTIETWIGVWMVGVEGLEIK